MAARAVPGLDLTVMVANHGAEKALKKRFNVRAQSTFVGLPGQQDWARPVGESDPAAIRTAFKSAL
jgi:hypothetical protein